MTLRVSGKNMDIGEALRSQVEARVQGAIAKYFDGSVSGHVTVEREGTGFRTDCVLRLPNGVTLESSSMAHDAYAAFDQTAHRIEKRLRRHKRRIREHPAGNGHAAPFVDASYAVIEAPDDDEAPEQQEFHPVVIHETTRALHTLAVSEAVLQLDLSGAPCLVFHHAGTGRLNIVYRRTDGAIGWIDPPAEQPK